MNFGATYKTGRFKEDASIDGDTVRYDINRDGIFNSMDIVVGLPASQLHFDFRYFEHSKNYFYLNNRLKLLDDRLIMNLGIRYDYFTYSKKGNVSPRFSASYYLVPSITSLNIAYGDFYQTQSYPTYGDRFGKQINRYLENSHAKHFVIGIEHVLDDGLKVNLEGYYKKYTDLPVDEKFIHFTDRTFRSEERFNIGKQTNYGIDLLIQQKLVKDIYGTLAFSRMWTKFDDPRIGYEEKSFPSEYDFPYVVTLIVGKRFNNLRSKLDEMPFFIKYPTYILPFSDDMEISVRWRYASGKPYTPREYVHYEQHREGGSKWSDGWWIATDNINGARYPDYHRLDIGLNSRYNFKTWSLSVFLSIQNVYNRKNIAFYQYNSDGTTENVYQFAILPVAGIEVKF